MIPMMTDCSPHGMLLRSLQNYRDALPKLSHPEISPEYPHQIPSLSLCKGQTPHHYEMKVMNENNARLIQLLTVANRPPSVAPPIPDVEQSHHSNRPGGRSQNHSTDRVRRGIHRSPSPLQHKGSSSSSESSEIPIVKGQEARRGRSPRRGGRIGTRDRSTSQKI
ncbi:hypothetical protein Acr_26g0001020 [Actinidia rufa]|uniref:Uncharacterized protein n=1 Tax=Actinidia rufa TaxID=165716 RepID=A0A7J0H1A8_9ERIC|nr:hypothetical protein Acr_26g0001020 [Actinidia rufa]